MGSDGTHLCAATPIRDRVGVGADAPPRSHAAGRSPPGPLDRPIAAAASSPAFVRPLVPLLGACEARLAQAVAGYGADISDPAAETLAAGGKRVRPLLVFCAAPRRPEAHDGLVSAAAAVELVHMATLVHDDLIDGATLRRGRPTGARP